jgi:hypothetical protein
VVAVLGQRPRAGGDVVGDVLDNVGSASSSRGKVFDDVALAG